MNENMYWTYATIYTKMYQYMYVQNYAQVWERT